MGYDARHRGGSISASTLVLLVLLVGAAFGALALARQRPIVPLSIPPPAWSVAGHDAARDGHSLSYHTALPITRLAWRAVPPIGRPPVIDGYGTTYLAEPDGALLALNANLDTSWCAALVQPITDTSCTGPAETPPFPVPVTPSAVVGPDGYIYVVSAGGALLALDRGSPHELWRDDHHLVPDDGVVFGSDPGTMYGVAALSDGDAPLYAVVALRWKGAPAPGWRATPIRSRGLSTVTVAPDGTVLVAARSSVPGRPASLIALDTHGRPRWRLTLAPGQPSLVSTEGTAGGWAAWVAIAGAARSWVVVVNQDGAPVWRWSTGHPLAVRDGGVALAHPGLANPALHGLGYVGSTVGVYGLDLGRRHAWLFSDTRRLGATGAPVTDVQNAVYVATTGGHVLNLWPDGRLRWRYDTHRREVGALALYPNGSVLVTSSDASGATVAETLGAGGTALQGKGALCAPPDCPTPTPEPTASATITPTGTATAAATITGTATVSATVTGTATAR